MVNKVKKSKINFKGRTVNIGIDMHKISWRITALVEGDTVLAITLAKPTYSGPHVKDKFHEYLRCTQQYYFGMTTGN